MTRSMMLTMLRQGNTGNQILQILDALIAEDSAEVSINEPTEDPIDF